MRLPWLNNHDKWLYGINDKLAAEDTAISANATAISANATAISTKLDVKGSLFANVNNSCPAGSTWAAQGNTGNYFCTRD